MQEIITSLKLPFSLSRAKLEKDLASILEEKWIPHFNQTCYRGDWKVIPLYAVDGNETNIISHGSSSSEIKETSILKSCGYFKEVIESFKCKVLSARILRLGAGAEIKSHTDYNLGYEDNNFRIHIPIRTNNKVMFFLDGKLLKMLPGECWYTNVNFVHSVKNNGTTDRAHLVIDYERNNWSDELFFSLAPESRFLGKKVEIQDSNTLKMIIRELENQNEPASEQLIADLRLQLAKIN